MNYKKDFPIFKNNKNLVYLDSAATSQKPQVVLNSIKKYYENYNSNIHRGIYKIAERSSAKVDEVRKKVSKFINAKYPEEIIFTKGTTESINLVMYSYGKEFIKDGDTIVTTIMDHHANFVPWQELAKEKNANFEVVGITPDGLLDEKDLLLKTKDAKIFAMPYISNVLGSINWVSKFVEQIRKNNPSIIIVIDAAQAVAFKKVDVEDLDCDFLAFSGHKMFAGTGIGVLYGKRQHLQKMPPFLFGGDMIEKVLLKTTSYADLPNKFEGGTQNIEGVVSLGAAIDYINSIGIEKIMDHEKSLSIFLLEKLKKFEMITPFGPKDKFGRSSIVSFKINRIHPHDIAQILADENICIRAGHHCTMPLHTYLKIPGTSRVSFSIYNTEEDIEKLIEGLKKAIKIFK